MNVMLKNSSINLSMVGIFISIVVMAPLESRAELYSCNKNGTIVISSQRCDKSHTQKNLVKRSLQTCFLEDPSTHEQLLVTNPSREQLKRTKIIWCQNKSNPLENKSVVESKKAHKVKHRKRTKGGGRSLPKRAEAYKEFVQRAAEKYELPEALLWAFMKVESDFIPSAVSRVGAQGLMQLMPLTAKDMGVNDPFDPQQNIYGAAKLISILMKRFQSELPLVISAYHAGGGAVTRKEGIPYTQTSQYMTSVLNAYYRYMKTPPYIRQSTLVEKKAGQ